MSSAMIGEIVHSSPSRSNSQVPTRPASTARRWKASLRRRASSPFSVR